MFEIKTLIDWLSFTTKIHNPSQIIELLGLQNVLWRELENSRYGWTREYCFSDMHIRFGGRADVAVDFSGTGCRAFETEHNNSYDWAGLLSYIFNHRDSMHLSRLDVAGDENDGIIKLQTVMRHRFTGRYISKARKGRISHELDGVAIIGEVVYIGSPSSDILMRIYNKAFERKVDYHWTRVEMQFRNDAAYKYIELLQKFGSISSAYASYVKWFIRFTTETPTNNNHKRMETCKWWSRFLGEAQKAEFITGGLEYNLDDTRQFLQRQAASSIKAVVEADGGDWSSIFRMVDNAELSKKQVEAIEEYKFAHKVRTYELEQPFEPIDEAFNPYDVFPEPVYEQTLLYDIPVVVRRPE